MSQVQLPDVAQNSKPEEPSRLNWVGMKGIVMPLAMCDKNLGVQKVRSEIDCSVDLNDPQARGIHMSRMYLSLTKLSLLEKVNYGTLEQLTKDFVLLQEGYSTSSKVSIRFDLCVERESLLSGHKGWLDYPVQVSLVNLGGMIKCQIEFKIIYSSTCPCSAALSRQLISDRFVKHFDNGNAITKEKGQEWLKNEEKMMATPHSQRSIAEVKLVVRPQDNFPFLHLINMAEDAIKTRVQSVVKREDEQSFASLNGENLMFCEDAARILQKAFTDFSKDGVSIKVRHLESLHPHDAIAEVLEGDIIT